MTEVAAASPICDAYRTPGQTQQLANCERAVARIPNKQALRYTLNYLNANRGPTLADPSCAAGDGKLLSNDRCVSCRDPNWVRAGIENGCTFVLNDLKRPWSRKGQRWLGRTTAYFVDLCTTDPTKVVTEFYVNGGGQRPPGPSDRSGSAHILAGAFKLEGDVRGDFNPFRRIAGRYAGIRARNNGNIPVIRMAGLNSSNNDQEFDRPMHVTPFNRSLGCVSVAESTAPIMRRIAASGSSLLMNYDPDFEQRGNSCRNDDSDGPRSSGARTTGAGEGHR